MGKKNKKFIAHLRHTGKAESDFGSIRALRLGGVADKRNPIVPGANWFGILVIRETNPLIGPLQKFPLLSGSFIISSSDKWFSVVIMIVWIPPGDKASSKNDLLNLGVCQSRREE